MNAAIRKQLPVIIVVVLIGFITGCILMTLVHDSASSMGASQFSMIIFIIPCLIMLAGSFIIAFTADEIGRQLYIVSLALCLVCGAISMIVGSSWLSDPAIAEQLLANSPDGTVITPILNSPITIIRDIAAFVVVPTVGCVLGAWAGSRVHPMRREKRPKKGKK